MTRAEPPSPVREHEAAGRYVSVDGVQIFVRDQGTGPPVLLLHGVPTSSFLYRHIIPELAERGLRAVSFDFPGTGLSDKPRDIAYDWHALAQWTEAIVATLELDSVHLVVHDIAGPIGIEWATGHPTRVRTLTLTNTLLDVSAFRRPFPMNMFVIPGVRQLAFASQHGAAMLPLMRQRGVKHPERIDRDVADSYIWLLKRADGQQPFLSIMAGFDLSHAHRDWLRDGLLSLHLPTQVVWGEHEVAIPHHQLEYIRQTFPLEQEHRVDARHFLQEDAPQQCAHHIATFANAHR